MINIYTDISLINESNRRIVFPLLFDLLFVKNVNLLEKYNIVNKLTDADIAIVPVNIGFYFETNQSDILHQFINDANLLHKNVWIYTAGDIGITLKKEVYTFRLEGFASKFDEKTFIIPSFINDPYATFVHDFTPIIKTEKPKIGFVGHANGSTVKKIKEFLIFVKHNSKRFFKQTFSDYQSFFPSSIIRFKLLSILRHSNDIETDFIFRSKYRAGATIENDKAETSKVFYESIFNNPYTFCMRGAGNFSVRFYETLAMGRIPVVVDTDFRLPLHDKIEWKNHCVLVSKNNIEKSLIDFHKAMSNDDFVQMQINNRKLWVNFLQREAYFSEIYNIFKK